jgi:hypothetical protein
MTSRQRADRDAAIFEDRARGYGWRRIAADHDLTERQCQRIASDYRLERPSLSARDPVETVEEILDAHDAGIEDLAVLAASTGHDGVRLGAIRARLSAIEAKANLLTAVGVLPHDLGRLGGEISFRGMTQRIVTVLHEHDAGEELARALSEAVRPSTAPGRDHVASTG